MHRLRVQWVGPDLANPTHAGNTRTGQSIQGRIDPVTARRFGESQAFRMSTLDTHIIDCPRCGVPFLVVPPSPADAVCGTCGRRYRVRPISETPTPTYTISLLHGASDEEPRAAFSPKTGTTRLPGKTHSRIHAAASRRAAVVGLWSAIGLAVAASAVHPERGWWILFAVPIAIATYWGVRRKYEMGLLATSEERQIASMKQALLILKRDLREAVVVPIREAQEKMKQRERIDALVTKMKSLELTLYSNRIQELETTSRLLDEQCAAIVRLVAGCERTEKNVDIELESLELTAEIGDSTSAALHEKLTELEMLKEQVNELQGELDARAEVETLLH